MTGGLFGLVLLVVGVGVLVGACGSGEGPEATGTAGSERVERAATVDEQAQAVSEEVAEQAVEESAAAAEVEAVEAAQVEGSQVESEEGEDEVVALPVDVVGVHKGLRSERNMLGDPDAPVEILYYGDFT